MGAASEKEEAGEEPVNIRVVFDSSDSEEEEKEVLTGEKQANIRDVIDSSDSEEEEQEVVTSEPLTPNLELTLPEEFTPRVGQLKEADKLPHDQRRGSHVEKRDHHCSHWVRACQGDIEVQTAPQVTHVVKTKSTTLDDGCAFWDILLYVPLSTADWAVVIGDSRHQHPLSCSCKRRCSESEEGGSEDCVGQEGIFILDEAEETGSQEENKPEPPTQGDGRTAPRPTPNPVSDPPMECVMAQRIPDISYYYPMTDIITTGAPM